MIKQFVSHFSCLSVCYSRLDVSIDIFSSWCFLGIIGEMIKIVSEDVEVF